MSRSIEVEISVKVEGGGRASYKAVLQVAEGAAILREVTRIARIVARDAAEQVGA